MFNCEFIMNYVCEEKLLNMSFFKNHPELSSFASKYHNEFERECYEEEVPEIA